MQVLLSTNPVMAALCAWLVVGEQWHWNEFTSASTTILGVFFVVMPSLLSGHASSSGHWHSWTHYAGVLLTVSSSASAAAMFTCMRILGTRVKVHVLVVMLINGLAQLVLGLVSSVGFGFLTGDYPVWFSRDDLFLAAGVGCVPRSWPRLRLHLADRLLAGRTHRGKHTGGFRHHPCGLGGCSLREVAERTTGAEDPPNHRAKFEHRWEEPKVAGLIPTA